MNEKKLIGIKDANGNELYEGAKVSHENIDGQPQQWTIVWSNYRNSWMGDSPDEIYDLGPSLLAESELINS